MSATSTPVMDARQPAARRLKLVVSTPPPPNQADSLEPATKEHSSSPVRPSYSPVTPTLPHATLSHNDAPQSSWMDEPEPFSVNMDDNPDAIALRATISLLQMQRQQSIRDIRNLEKVKQKALRDPEAFVNDLKDGKLQTKPTQGIILDQDSDDEEHVKDEGSNFGKLPTAQNIARCPPIEWSKYHVVGEPFNRMHAMQQDYPGFTEEALARRLQPVPHEIAAPYRPFSDRVNSKVDSSDNRGPDR